MSDRSDIQYNGGGSSPSRSYRRKFEKSPIEHLMDYEDAMREISKMPPSERRAALAAWKRGYRK